MLIFCSVEWFAVSKEDVEQIFSPTLKILKAKDVTRERRYGAVDMDFYWFKNPHFFQYQQALKVTIYCPMDFSNFPFDSHSCDLLYGSSYSTANAMQLYPPPVIHVNDKNLKFGDKGLKFHQDRLPFIITLESLESFDFFEGGFNYSYAGMRIHLSRNSLGLLIGGFYGPTCIFAMLSLISYGIDLSIVSFSFYLRISTIITFRALVFSGSRKIRITDYTGFDCCQCLQFCSRSSFKRI